MDCGLRPPGWRFYLGPQRRDASGRPLAAGTDCRQARGGCTGRRRANSRGSRSERDGRWWWQLPKTSGVKLSKKRSPTDVAHRAEVPIATSPDPRCFCASPRRVCGRRPADTAALGVQDGGKPLSVAAGRWRVARLWASSVAPGVSASCRGSPAGTAYSRAGSSIPSDSQLVATSPPELTRADACCLSYDGHVHGSCFSRSHEHVRFVRRKDVRSRRPESDDL